MFNFLKKSKPEFIVDLSQLAVDCHSHLIPGIDDGAKTLEESINLIVEFQKLGYKKVITTPHIMSDYYRNTPEIILSGLELVRNELSRLNIEMQIEAAAEYYYDENFLAQLEKKNLLTIHKEYVLFELSYLSKPTGIREVVFDVLSKGYKPILAHPERYPYLSMNDHTAFKEAGCFYQVNLLSFCGHYGKTVKETVGKLVDYNLIDFLASDLHHMQHMRIIKNAVIFEEKLSELLSFGNLKNIELL